MNLSDPNQLKRFFKQALTSIIGVYFTWHAFHLEDWIFLDGVNLVIHEAGHFVFALFGEFIHIAGGSIMQILMPLLFVLYFWRREEVWQSSVCMFWLGESILNTAFYAKDAQTMLLPLLGGDGVIHDWNYLLTTLNLISYTTIIYDVIFLVGFSIILCAIFIGFDAAGKTQYPQI